MGHCVRVLAVVIGATACGAQPPVGSESGSGSSSGSSSSSSGSTGDGSSTGLGTTAPATESSSSTTEGSAEVSSGTEGAGVIFDVGVMPDAPIEVPTFDCGDIPELPVAASIVRTIPGGEDLEFDALGNLVVAERGLNALFLIPRVGNQVLLNPDINLTSTAGTAVLPDGDIVVADEFSPLIARVDPNTGQMTPIPYGPGIGGCNGLIVGSDGMLYCATYWDGPPTSGVARIDPDTGDAEFLYAAPGIDGITFAADETYLYFNEGEFYGFGNGRLFRAPFDGDLGDIEDLGPPLAGSQGTVDGMVSDVCGNVYIATQNVNNAMCAGSSVVRVTPDDTVAIATCLGNGAFTPGIAFGSGVGGWEADALYVIDWVGVVWEVPVGVPGEVLPHLRGI